MKLKFTVFLLILSFFSIASANVRSGLNIAPLAVQYIMADPPLPSVDGEKGDHQTLVKPGYIFGDYTGNYTGATESGSISGPTLGANYTYTLNSKWSVYGWFVGAKFSGNSKTVNGSTPLSKADNIDVDFYNLSAGVSYLISSNKTSKSFVSVFGGPYIPIYRFSQTFTNQESSNAVVAEMEANHSFYGLLLGIQWQKEIHKNWNVNSFFVLADTFGSGDFMNPFGDSGECKQFKVKSIISGSSAGIQEVDPECAGGADNEFWFDTQIGGVGVSLEYIPWKLKANLFSPFFNRFIFDMFYEEMEPEFIYLSFSWAI